MADDYLHQNLQAIGTALAAALPAVCHPAIERHLAPSLQRAADAPKVIPSWLASPGPLRDEARRFLLAL